MKKSKKITINSLLRLISDGKTEFNDEVEENEVISLAKDLGIEIIQLASTGKKIKIEAPIVPEAEPKNEDPGLMELKDGSFGCGICFKKFPRRRNLWANKDECCTLTNIELYPLENVQGHKAFLMGTFLKDIS